MAKKVLIIDDEVDVMKMIIYRLKAKGYEVLSAVSGQEGISTAAAFKPDLIILDYRLPDIQGPEVSKRIKQTTGLEQIPILLITASTQNIENKAKECMAIDFLSKPFEPEELYLKVRKWIS